MPRNPLAKKAASGARRALVLAAALALLVPIHGAADDSVLFSTYVQPNVLLMLDNSGSMTHIVWHEDFDPTATPACTAFDNNAEYFYSNNTTVTLPSSRPATCVASRPIYHDNSSGGDTRWSGRYLNWYFSNTAVSNAAATEMALGSNGFPSSCVGGAAFAKYKRSRLTAAKQAIKDIVCEVNELTKVKFGLAVFRDADNGDPNGGYVLVPVAEYNSGQASDLTSALQSVRADSWTPLSEALFQSYTYFMSRTTADIPTGADGTTTFPRYEYRRTTNGVGGEHTTNSTNIPGDPVEYACQKNFVIVITDGEPTMDHFVANTPTNTGRGFSSFGNLIGNYNPDAETEYQDDLICTDCRTTFYLDDIAKFMHERDFRPDFDDDQTIDVYTVGFTTGTIANNLLQKTADVSNGIFFQSNNATDLAQAIIAAFSDIIAKAQSFTAATVPATRTAAGESLYVTQFVPSENTPYWQGHMKAFEISGAGEILDKDGNCALQDPTPGQCFGGPFIAGAPPFWDAGEEVPAPGARSLYTTKLVGGVPTKVPFDDTLTAADLGVATFPPASPITGSTALTIEGLTDELIQNVRGCTMGTGVSDGTLVGTPAACVQRPWLLGDIFHSNPRVVGSPALFLSEESYSNFSTTWNQRDSMIFAGTNDGFLRGFLSGVWDPALNPPRHDRGTGVEQFGFMPWTSRQVIKNLPTDTAGRDYYFVDGSPQVSDVWMYGSATQGTKLANGSEWKTVMITGLREGGESYLALDVTDPSALGYPGYLWEFPRENDPAALQNLIGETWSEPIITRIRVKVGSDDNGGAGYERWVAVVAGGYDVTGDPNHPSYDPNGTKGRSIFLIDVKTGQPLAAKYYQPAAGDAQADMDYAAPATVGVYDLDFDGYADVLYWGDLGGQVFKWVIKDLGDDRVNDGSGLLTQPNWPFVKFFQAPVERPGGGEPYHYKSFFFPPAATLRNGQLWLALGSGERENLPFAGVANRDEDNNRFYVLRENDPYEEQVPAQTLPILESDLLDVSNTTSCSDTSAYRGYYLVAEDAEKFVTNVDIFLYYVFVASYIPTNNTDPCEVGGLSFLYVFRVHCGEGFFDDGSGGTERVLDLGPGMPTDPKITVGTEGDGSHRIIINKQGGDILSIEAPPGFQGSGMFYWREIFE